MTGLRLAVTTLTILPAGRPVRPDRRAAGAAMRLAPVLGLLLGGAAGTVLVGVGRLTGGSALGAALAVGLLAALTRGLHLDGLADLADGLGSSRPADRARAVMKQPDIGPFGVVTVVLVLLVQVTALAAADAHGRGFAAAVVAAAAGRLALTAGCTAGVPAAGPTGLGALVAGTVRRGWTFALALLSGAVGTAVLALESGQVAAGPAAAVAAGLLTARLLRDHAVRRLDGITGDVLGALVEVATAAALVVMAVPTPSLAG